MAKGSGTDTSRDGETAKNTPSNDETADKNAGGTHEPVDANLQDNPEEHQANLGIGVNERIGKFKEEYKQELALLQEQVKSLIHKLDELG